MKCSEIMTKDPVCCLPSDTVVRAEQLMKTENVYLTRSEIELF
jgi:CBS domain-containing protein